MNLLNKPRKLTATSNEKPLPTDLEIAQTLADQDQCTYVLRDEYGNIIARAEPSRRDKLALAFLIMVVAGGMWLLASSSVGALYGP